MRIAVSASAIALLAALVESASSNPQSLFALPQDSRIRFGSQQWITIPYGGDSESPLRNDKNENTISQGNGNARAKPTSSKILDTVSAGGAFHSDAAFIGTQTRAPQTRSPPSRSEENHSDTSMAVATNQHEDTNTADVTSDDSVQNKEPLRVVPRKTGPLKILFLSSDTGGGHRASAEALANQFQRLFPGTTYDLFDIWTDVDSSWPYYTIKDTYKSFSATPWKWRTLYHVSNNVVYSKLADLHSYYMNEEKIFEKLEEYNPDVIVSVHPTMNYVPLFSARKLSEKNGKDIPFFTVVTDFGSGHCTWFNKDVDKMYLASKPIKAIAQVRCGVPDEKIVMSGLPIRYDFAKQADAMGDRTTPEGKAHQAKIREGLEIDTNKRMVLVVGGGEGVGSLSDIVNEIYAKLRTQGVDATICVICGRNEKLKADLETRCWDTVVSQSLKSYESLKSRLYTRLLKLHATRSRRIQLALDRAAARAEKGDVAATPGKVDVVPLGFVKNMAEYMVAADVLVTKAGPGTIAEAAAVGLPIMVTSHLPGQEAGNVDIVLNGGFGDFCEDPETIALEIACWLQESHLLDDMSRKAMKVGHPHAAEEIALDIGETAHAWIERNSMKRNNKL
ncbi:hypothetical protein HJC23_012806 [Cyclotella cryptica]|uniref:monogalactosyldiacylglycerol synthase n=1 Tax=Cyclotella cryptica TaxID=29204 RepID=A0ABD3P0A9_9STRA|eukprot:CCRYP_018605-RA/>CCRYP_018605-RA protein AED:0.23 eAED:0.23 QI:586/1/1/1/0.8/0.66/6/1790/618